MKCIALIFVGLLAAGSALGQPSPDFVTQPQSNNSTKAATTAYVRLGIANLSLGTTATQNANAVALTGGTISGLTSLGLTGLLTTKNITNSGPSYNAASVSSSANSFLYASPAYFGSSSVLDENYIGISDSVNYYGPTSGNGMRVQLAYGGGTAAGGRNGFQGSVGIQAQPNPGNVSKVLGNGNSAFVGLYGNAFATVHDYGYPGAISPSSYNGAIWGGWSFPRFASGATGWQSQIGHEIDVAVPTGTSAATVWGAIIVATPTHANRGQYSDAALAILGPNPDSATPGPAFKYGIEFGDPTASAPTAADSTLIGAPYRTYGGVASVTKARYGIDFRNVTVSAGGEAWASSSAAINQTGGVFGNGVTTSNIVQAKSATLTGVTINTDNDGSVGGAYPGFPTFSVAPATMGGAMIGDIGSTGRGYVSSTVGGDVLTYVGGTGGAPTWRLWSGAFTGVISGYTLTTTGTTGKIAPGAILAGTGVTAGTRVLYQLTGATNGDGTYQLDQSQAVGSVAMTTSSVDASGSIVAVLVGTSGSLTSAAANPIYPTGGSGTGAGFNVTYRQSTTLFLPEDPTPFAATGGGYTAGDVITVVGDTGTAAAFTVGLVDSFGGARKLTAAYQRAITVGTVGSLTAIAAPAYHSVNGGTGTGAALLVAYRVLTLNTTPGSGYLPEPLPLITSSNTSYRAADLTGLMTAASATLSLNPTGGAVTSGGQTIARMVAVPGTSSTACVVGDFSADATHVYACYATNTWTRSAAATW